jgi:hypothetical protein
MSGQGLAMADGVPNAVHAATKAAPNRQTGKRVVTSHGYPARVLFNRVSLALSTDLHLLPARR